MTQETLRRSDGPVARATRRRDVDVPTRPRRSAATGTATAVARAVLDHGPVARSTVARVTGVSSATVSIAATQLLEAGILREAPEAAGPPGAGRPHVPLDIEADRLAVVGVHLAVPSYTVALLDLRGRVLTRVRTRYVDGPPTPADALALVGAAIRRLVEETERRVLGVGVATGGWVDPGAGVLVEHPVLGWRDVPLREILGAATGLPVDVDGHGRALVRAERLFGASANAARSSLVHLFTGNVVDVAFAVGDTVHHGPRSAGGAVAHLPVEGCAVPCVCGRVGCLQAAVSERAVVARAMAAGLIDEPDILLLIGAAEAGERRAIELFKERARLVGRAAATLLDLFNPDVLTVAETASNRIPEVFAALLAEVESRSVVAGDRDLADCIRPSSFRGEVLAVAGGAVMLDRVYADPLARAGALKRAC